MRRRLLWPWVLLLAAGLCNAQPRTDASALEYQRKAGYIFKFATFIHWPAATAANATTPFVVGVIGTDPFGSALGAVVRGRTVQGRAIVVRNLAGLEDVLHCDMLFVSSSEEGNLRQIFAAVRDAPVLTVGDTDRFAELGGMIHLITTTEDPHIRFDINKGAIERAGLKASSRLLRLARIVDESR